MFVFSSHNFIDSELMIIVVKMKLWRGTTTTTTTATASATVTQVRRTMRGLPSCRPTMRGPLSKRFLSERLDVAQLRSERTEVT